MLQERARTVTAYRFLVGLMGALCLAWSTVQAAPPGRRAAAEAAVVMLLASLCWRQSVIILSRARFSLDLSFLLLTLMCFPSPLPAAVGAGAAVLGSLLRRREGPGRQGPVRELSFLLINTGTLVLMMTAGSAARAAMESRLPPALAAPARIAALLAALSAVLMLVNLLVVGSSVALRGGGLRDLLARHASAVLPWDAANLPLAALMVITRERAGFGPLALLLCLAVGASWLVRRLALAERELRRSNEALGRRAAQLEAIDEIARRIAANLDLGSVFETIRRQVARALDATTFAILLARPGGTGFQYAFLDVDGVPGPAARFPAGEAMAARVAAARRPFLGDGDGGPASVLAVPLPAAEGEPAGCLIVGSARPGAYGPAEQELLESIGRHAAIALANARYHQMATVDQATGLYLKTWFLRRLEEEMARSRRHGRPVSLLMLDLDDFKRVNDTFGHPAGDELLRRVAAVIREGVRAQDIAARYGGEEFAVLLPECGSREAAATAERIRRRVSLLRVGAGGRVFGATVSIGIASCPRHARRSAAELLRKADGALYRSKREGKDRVTAAA
ncbi:MAG TPA: GGDEF domain-containing protein [Candidatus Polarisedimenticolia bacterium]|nr:GGDEF domain-containing protein [Candidatus Polarisedimenticolia bacterium]